MPPELSKRLARRSRTLRSALIAYFLHRYTAANISTMAPIPTAISYCLDRFAAAFAALISNVELAGECR